LKRENSDNEACHNMAILTLEKNSNIKQIIANNATTNKENLNFIHFCMRFIRAKFHAN